MEIEDVTGTPRPDRDVVEAMRFVTEQVVREPMAMTKTGVPYTIHFMVIKDALLELLERRAKEAREAGR